MCLHSPARAFTSLCFRVVSSLPRLSTNLPTKQTNNQTNKQTNTVSSKLAEIFTVRPDNIWLVGWLVGSFSEVDPPPKLRLPKQEEEEDDDDDASSSHTVVQEKVGDDDEPSDDDVPLSTKEIKEATKDPPKVSKVKAPAAAAARPTKAETVEVLGDGQGLKLNRTGKRSAAAQPPATEEKAEKGEVDKKKRAKAVQKGQK